MAVTVFAHTQHHITRLGSSAKIRLTGADAGSHFAAIQAEFEKVFPRCGLGCMTGYRVYGLVNSKR
jgi:hypothetical protein